jgi:pyruvate/2-oxoglutarate dehydrogenase complex dihydrolipoamide acyltransferase (E2) component
VGPIAPRPSVGEDGHLGVRPTAPYCRTFDHRVAGGAAAAGLIVAVVAACAALERETPA